MSGPRWFDPEPSVKERFWFPGAEAEANLLRQRGDHDGAQRLTDEYSFEAELRELTAGDDALRTEMQVSEGGGGISLGKLAIESVAMSLTSWTLPMPIGREALERMPGDVVQAMFSAIPKRTFDRYERESGGAKGSGPPPPAAEAAATPREAADSS
jgi:hypothetical protein